MTTVAVLDENDVLVGFTEKQRPTKKDVVVPTGCDLKTDGRYRYVRAYSRFDPIPEVLVRVGDTAIINQQIVLYLLGALSDDQVTQHVRDSANFIRATDPLYEDKIKKKYAAATSRKT